MQQISVVIHDEGDRRVLETALWKSIRGTVDPTDMTSFGSAISEMEDAALGMSVGVSREDIRRELDEMIDRVITLRVAVDQIATTQLGETFAMPLAASDLSDCISYAKVTVEEYGTSRIDGGFWNQSPEVRAGLLASRDAAVRLLESLAPAAAVAS
jgi:hypothetical protein